MSPRDPSWSFSLLKKKKKTFINDLPDDMRSNLSICADDTTIYTCPVSKADQSEKLEIAADVKKDDLFLFSPPQSLIKSLHPPRLPLT